MDEEKNERYSCFYLRRINNKLSWLMFIIAVTLIVKCGSYIWDFIGWLIGVFSKGGAA